MQGVIVLYREELAAESLLDRLMVRLNNGAVMIMSA